MTGVLVVMGKVGSTDMVVTSSSSSSVVVVVLDELG
jgi:hypothetical protein